MLHSPHGEGREAMNGLFGPARVDCGEAPPMAGFHGIEQRAGLGVAYFADQDAIGTMTQHGLEQARRTLYRRG